MRLLYSLYPCDKFATFYVAHFCEPGHSNLSPTQNYNHNGLLYEYQVLSPHIICALSVFSFRVASSPVWNSKDTLKVPFAWARCVCVLVRGSCGWRRPLLNGWQLDRMLVLSATQLSRCQASCSSQLMLIVRLLLLVACKKFSL